MNTKTQGYWEGMNINEPGKLPEFYTITSTVTSKVKRKKLKSSVSRFFVFVFLNLERLEPGNCKDLTKVTQMGEWDVLSSALVFQPRVHSQSMQSSRRL